MSEINYTEIARENQETMQEAKVEFAPEAAEQAEMNEMNEMNEAAEQIAETDEAREQAEMDEGENEVVGYSSDYYRHEYARALKNNNGIAAKNAMNNYAKAKARETLK